MLGFAPLAAAPLGAAGTGGVAYDVEFSDAATATDTALQAFAGFATATTTAATGTDEPQVAASTFAANVSAAADGVMTTTAAVVFLANTSNAATGADAASSIGSFQIFVSDGVFSIDFTTVKPSDFSATVSDAAAGDGAVSALADMVASFTGSVTITDADMADYLWKIINDAQSANWGTINNAQPVVWTPVRTQA